MALCSLSTGNIFTLFFAASDMIIFPAITSASFVARAISLPAFTAAYVGARPGEPTIAETTMSTPSRTAASTSPSSPETTFRSGNSFRSSLADPSSNTAATSGLKAFICSASSLILLPTASALTLNLSGWFEITSRVFLPIEPVEPKIESVFKNTSL